MKRVGSTLMEGLSLSCGMERSFFAERFGDPWCLLRILSYPQQPHDAGADVGMAPASTPITDASRC
jgi:isopenicillin N synthase-like dioxygenase